MFLKPEDLAKLRAAETHAFRSPIPTQMISNGEFAPEPQSPEQRRVEARIRDLGERYGQRQKLDRRQFLKTASGMAAAFLAMNEVHGAIFDVAVAEAEEPEAAAARAAAAADQFVFDAQVHFVKDELEAGTNPFKIFGIRQGTGPFLNPDLRGHEHSIDDIKFQNFIKEVFFDSDTKMAILSGAPSDEAAGWFLSNEQMARARQLVNEAAGSRRLLCHAVVTPGQDGWMDDVDKAIDTLKPDSWKGYTMGDPLGPSKYMWRLDDEKLVYPFFEKAVQAGITNICLHKGLLPPNAEQSMPGVTRHADVSDVGQAAKDWPQLNFIIYHCGYNVIMPSTKQREHFEATGEIEWVTDLARIPEKYGVRNVFPEIGTSFALSSVISPRFCAGMLGMLIAGFGAENVFWGTDSVWYGSPQWQLEAFRRMEIPEDLQEKFGYAPLGAPDGPVKSGILGLNTARHYGIDPAAAGRTMAADALAKARAAYRAAGGERSNLAYGFVAERL